MIFGNIHQYPMATLGWFHFTFAVGNYLYHCNANFPINLALYQSTAAIPHNPPYKEKKSECIPVPKVTQSWVLNRSVCGFIMMMKFELGQLTGICTCIHPISFLKKSTCLISKTCLLKCVPHPTWYCLHPVPCFATTSENVVPIMAISMLRRMRMDIIA